MDPNTVLADMANPLNHNPVAQNLKRHGWIHRDNYSP